MSKRPAHPWKPTTFPIPMFTPGGEGGFFIREADGFSYAGLGMHKIDAVDAKGRKLPHCWSLTHLESGHYVFRIHAPMIKAFDLATEIANLGDWTFTHLEGWKNTSPDLFAKLTVFYEKNSELLARQEVNRNHEAARAIAERRA